jgi:multimeric flavodoxin WrbA
MNVLAINGSPRKKWNTATLLGKALEGAASAGAETDLIHLYDLNYKGCISCFACKTNGHKSYGKCAVKDDLMPIFNKIENAQALILGSPVYFGSATGEMRSFLERLFFPYHTYTDPPETLFPGKINTGFIYTMNVSEDVMTKRGYIKYFKHIESLLQRILGASETLISTDTYQFEDYSKYAAGRFDADKKAVRHREVFPLECQKAFEMGARLAGGRG